MIDHTVSISPSLCCDTLLAVETTSGVSCILEIGEIMVRLDTDIHLNRAVGHLDFAPCMQKAILAHQQLRVAEGLKSGMDVALMYGDLISLLCTGRFDSSPTELTVIKQRK